jgi:hypothetical protein
MGYDLHITRRDHWADTEVSDISLDEWLSYVETDKELELTNGFEIKIGSVTEYKNAPGFCEWNAHPTAKDHNARPWFDYWKGSIGTKNPDEPTIRKMIQIATVLNAKVQGDDGEFYDEEYLIELETSQKQKSSLYQEYKKPWWRFW